MKECSSVPSSCLPLYEGTLLFMPSALPGTSITTMAQVLQAQDRIMKQFPEVEQVFGKAGQAETPTDPAPLEMIETVVNPDASGQMASSI